MEKIINELKKKHGAKWPRHAVDRFGDLCAKYDSSTKKEQEEYFVLYEWIVRAVTAAN